MFIVTKHSWDNILITYWWIEMTECCELSAPNAINHIIVRYRTKQTSPQKLYGTIV